MRPLTLSPDEQKGARWTEGRIAAVISRQTLAKKCVVLVDRCNWTGHECDVLGVTTDLRIIDVEIKISRADLKADAAKDKWWHRFGTAYAGTDPATGRIRYHQPDPVARQWPPKVWKHYYALPADIWTPELLDALPSAASGVIVLREHIGVIEANVMRRAKPNHDAGRLTPAQVVDIARLGNLRMWSAYEERDGAVRDRNHYAQQIRAVTGDCWHFGSALP